MAKISGDWTLQDGSHISSSSCHSRASSLNDEIKLHQHHIVGPPETTYMHDYKDPSYYQSLSSSLHSSPSGLGQRHFNGNGNGNKGNATETNGDDSVAAAWEKLTTSLERLTERGDDVELARSALQQLHQVLEHNPSSLPSPFLTYTHFLIVTLSPIYYPCIYI